VFSLENRSLSDMPFPDFLICAPSFVPERWSPGIVSAARRPIEASIGAKLPRELEMES
jgi:hypothetical protein